LIESKNIKNKAIIGFFWSLSENGGSYILHFLIGLVLIRLIEPIDYGIIAMMTFFVTLGTVISDFGLATALIQKKEPTDEDYSTVFWVNFIISVLYYLLIFAFSELISFFYSEPLIKTIIPIFSLNFIITAIGNVHLAKISRNLNYKLWTKINLSSLIIAGSISIVLAFNSMGIWALVFIQIIQNLSNTIQLWLLNKWGHQFKFSLKSFVNLLSFSKSISLVNIINTIYTELYNLLIGRIFQAKPLAYYLKAKQTSEIFPLQLSATTSKVMLPVFSNLQGDNTALIHSYNKVLILIGYLNFSVLAFLAANAESLFILLYTEKWITAVPYFKLLCIEGMFLPLHLMSANLLIAKGKTKKYMIIELSKRVIQAIIIILSLDSINNIIYGQILTGSIFAIIGFWVVSKTIHYSIFNQIKIIVPYILLSVAIFILNIITNNFLENFGYLFKITIAFFISLIFYLCFSYVFKLEAFLNIKTIVLNKITNQHN